MPSAVRTAKKKESFTQGQLTPPNREFITLTLTRLSATYKTASGKNETLTMEKKSDEEFTVTQGDTGVRWNNKKKVRKYTMSQWDDVYADLIRSGWTLFDTQRRKRVMVKSQGITINGHMYSPIKDKYVEGIVERLVSYANQMIECEYQQSILDVPEHAFEEASACLDTLAKEYENMSNKVFNEHLMHIFAVLPRRIDVLGKYIASKDATANDRAEIVETERERLQVLHTMLRGGNIHNLKGKENILEVYGIEMRRFTPEEEQLAKKLLKRQAGKFVRGWRVINKRTEKDFLSFCSKEHLSENHGVDYLFHGSKHQNWWSILTNGLTINPIGVVITGKAYGQGTYFAPDAIKSLGYTSKADAKYGGGHESTGFMAIYKVATGNRYDGRLGTDGQLNWEKLQKIQPGAHCTWAECRYSGFQMDEVIVYRNEQSTIWGLLELAM